ncbi:MAG: DUF7482 domain-containing protein [Acidimicrobiales bacterium]
MTDQHSTPARAAIDRRGFLGWAGSRGVALGVAGIGLPALLAACGDDDNGGTVAAPGGAGTGTSAAQAAEEARAIVGDVTDFALTSDEWPGAFGFVTLRIRKGAFDGNDVYFVRTDTSDKDFASTEELVYVPKLATMTGDGLSGAAYVVEDGAADQPVVFSSEPGRDDYTPAWTLHRVVWSGPPRVLRSEMDVRDAEAAGDLSIERTDIVINAGIVKWSDGEMAVDADKTAYLGKGMLLEPVDTTAMTATFKLGQCYPGSRYFVLDHSMAPMAEGTFTSFSPRLHGGPSEAGATGRTNVFMNGLDGPGPMGFQPSAFDFTAGEPAWSPYWDHWTYAWKDGVEPRLLTSQTAIHEARGAGDLDEFPGVPDTAGQIFTVNCPVPVLAPNTFEPA